MRVTNSYSRRLPALGLTPAPSLRVRSFFHWISSWNKNPLRTPIATIFSGNFTFMYFEDNDDDDDLNAADQLIALFLVSMNLLLQRIRPDGGGPARSRRRAADGRRRARAQRFLRRLSPLGGNIYYNYLVLGIVQSCM